MVPHTWKNDLYANEFTQSTYPPKKNQPKIKTNKQKKNNLKNNINKIRNDNKYSNTVILSSHLDKTDYNIPIYRSLYDFQTFHSRLFHVLKSPFSVNNLHKCDNLATDEV